MQTILGSGGSISIELAKSLRNFTDDVSSTEIISSIAENLRVISNTHQPGMLTALMRKSTNYIKTNLHNPYE